MKGIKQISGEFLLLFYKLQREGAINPIEIISFNLLDKYEDTGKKASELERALINVADGSRINVYESLVYLEQKCFLTFNISQLSGGLCNMHGFRVTAHGIDIIEGIERGEEEKNTFNINFNIKVADEINVESLVKAEVGSLLKGLLS